MKYNYQLTVITSTFNIGVEFSKTADSILNHKLGIQWIVCDGLSNDKSINIINEHKHIIDVFISEKDNGIYDAWNKSINYIKSDWVIFLGSGDVLIKENIDLLLTNLKNTKSNIVIGNLLLYNKYGKFIKKTKNEYLEIKKFKNGTINKPVNPEVIYSANIFNEIQFSDNYTIAGDTDFYIKAINKGYTKEFIDLDISRMVLDGISSNPLKHRVALNEVKQINIENNIVIPLYIKIVFEIKMKLKLLLYLIIGDNCFQMIRKLINK